MKSKITRSRNGCHNCKRLKIKCNEAKPQCSYCERTGAQCDYSLKLTWGGRPFKKPKKTETTVVECVQKRRDTGSQDGKRDSSQDGNRDSSQEGNRDSSWEGNRDSSWEGISPHDELLSQSKPGDGFPFDSAFPLDPEGIVSLNNMVEQTIGGAFKLQHSGIFSNYVNTHGTGEDAALADYEQDLARIEAFMGQPSNLVEEPIRRVWGSNDIEDSEHTQAKSEKLENPKTLEDFESPKRLDFENPNGERSEMGDGRSEMTSLGSVYLNSKHDDPVHFLPIYPPLLPLPQILLEVPYYRNLMHFWVHTASKHLVPAPSHIYKENPFKVLLPRMAMQYPSILTTLLAFSASLRSSLVGWDETPQEVIDQLLARSCTELLKLLRHKTLATSDPALATVLILSCYEVFVSKDFAKHRAHNLGARKIVMARENASSQGTDAESDITFFLMRWFVYVDVMGALSATHSAGNYLTCAFDESAKYAPVISVQALSAHMDEADPRRDIDHILGFDLNFLPLFSRIVLLIRRVDECESIPADVLAAAIDVRDQMARLYDAGEQRRRELEVRHDRPQDPVLRCTNRLFYWMGVVNLYRRVLRLPRTSQAVQSVVRDMYVAESENIVSRSPANICTIFCSFTAACEAIEGDMRVFYEKRFRKLAEMGNLGAKKGLRIMHECWERGVDWIEGAGGLDIDFVLL